MAAKTTSLFARSRRGMALKRHEESVTTQTSVEADSTGPYLETSVTDAVIVFTMETTAISSTISMFSNMELLRLQIKSTT